MNLEDLLRGLSEGGAGLIDRLERQYREQAGDDVRHLTVVRSRIQTCDNPNCTKRDAVIVGTLAGRPELASHNGVNLITIDEHHGGAYMHTIYDIASAIDLIEALQAAVNELSGRQPKQA